MIQNHIHDSVLEQVNSTISSVIGELTVALNKPYEKQNEA